MSSSSSPSLNVAWIRVGALGDLLISTAALKETIDRFPNSKIWVIGSPLWKEILEPSAWPQITRVVATKDGRRADVYLPHENQWELTLQNQSLAAMYWQFHATVNQRPESYRYAWGPFFARVPTRIGSCPRLMRWLYTDWAPWLGKDPVIHERDYHLLIALADRKNPERAKTIIEQNWKHRGLPLLRNPNAEVTRRLIPKGTQKFWLINPTSSRREKAWSSLRFKELSEQLKPLLAKSGRELFIVGAPHETEWLNEVSLQNIIQPQSIAELIALVGDAEFVITNTSSLQFIAASTETLCLVLMGRANPKIWGPLGPHDKVIRGGDLTPAAEGSIFQQEVEAYRAITVAHVFEEAKKLLATFEQV